MPANTERDQVYDLNLLTREYLKYDDSCKKIKSMMHQLHNQVEIEATIRIGPFDKIAVSDPETLGMLYKTLGFALNVIERKKNDILAKIGIFDRSGADSAKENEESIM